jgi:hypothetical protein
MDLWLKTCIFLSRLNGTHWERTFQIICKYSQDLVRPSSFYVSEDRYHKYDCILIFEANLSNILAKLEGIFLMCVPSINISLTAAAYDRPRWGVLIKPEKDILMRSAIFASIVVASEVFFFQRFGM